MQLNMKLYNEYLLTCGMWNISSIYGSGTDLLTRLPEKKMSDVFKD